MLDKLSTELHTLVSHVLIHEQGQHVAVEEQEQWLRGLKRRAGSLSHPSQLS